ncbi:response regulator [Flavobacterium lindanitolerans]|jgi:two-component system chemotaxis response regulator CheY|uniref:response regulator n=1 Tax=Flavobacterium lindanitolerans TaxID=428988 RepID=UPI0023F1B716|nr:response regulator [Flavobacterium lindanitolerans]MDQ7961848.1 response regulator [Flavobacterium lindanitolerans]
MKKFNDVFVVDDDKVYHFILKNLLKRNNIEVNSRFFENGHDAIEGLKENSKNGTTLPDLILLDINMPVMDGWQFLEEFRKIKGSLNKETVIYMVSSSNSPFDLNKAKDFPNEIQDYFLKPVCLEDICRIFLN